MVDAGGGNGILGILEKMNVDMAHIHHIFVTHEHTDHILGIVWMVRMIATAMKKGKYEGELRIYCHPGLADTISRSSPAPETSLTIRNVSHMWKAVSGFFTKHSASMVTENGSSLMKNITAQ